MFEIKAFEIFSDLMIGKGTVKHLMFTWDLFREFRDSLKIAKFNTSEFEEHKLNFLIFCFIFFFF